MEQPCPIFPSYNIVINDFDFAVKNINRYNSLIWNVL